MPNQDTDGNRMIWDETLRQWVPVTGALSPAELADQMQPVLSSRFGLDSIWISGHMFDVKSGSPTTRPAAAINSITLDPGAIESVTAGFRTHPSWTTATVTAWYYTLAATGNFLIYPTVYIAGVGESVAPTASTGITSPATVPPATVGIITAYEFGTFTCQPTKYSELTIMREGSAGADTNAGDFCLVGVTIAKAS